MTDAGAFFLPDGERLVPTVLTRGPWSPAHQHGGPPAAIMARAIERVIGDEDGLQLARVTVEFVRPVPIEPLTVRVECLRDGRRVRSYAAVLCAKEQEVARTVALVLRASPVTLPSLPVEEPLLPLPDNATPFQFPFFRDPVAYHTAVETRIAHGTFGTGRAAAWMRPRIPLVADETSSPVQRTLILADSGSGIGAVLDPARFVSFINADLTVALHRPPEGEWIGLDATTVLDRHGLGLTRTGLYDVRGPIGLALQSLVLAEGRPQ